MVSTEEFLSILFQDVPSRYFLELRAISSGKEVEQEWFSITAVGFAEAVRWARARDAQEFNVYFGVQPRSRRGGTGQDVAVVKTVYADQDCGTGKPFPEKENADDRLTWLCNEGRLPHPTFVVDSGHGIHSYWVLRESLAPTDTSFGNVMRGLAENLDGDSSVITLPQVMRLPGTMNWKVPDDATDCYVLEHGGNRPDISAFPKGGEPEPQTVSDVSQLPTELSRDARLLTQAFRKSGVRFRVRKRRNGSVRAIVLREYCPVCGGISKRTSRPDRSNKGSAHITPLTLRLKCKRTCPAEERDFEIGEWLPELFDPVPKELRKFLKISLEMVPNVLAEMWAEAMELASKGDVPIIAITPEGTGKTRFALERLAEDAARGKAGSLLVPTYELALEKEEELQALVPGTRTLVYQSIRRSCRRIEHIGKWQPYLPHQRGIICRKCGYRKECPAWTQFEHEDREHTVGIAAHAYLPELLAHNACGEYIVIDETYRAAEKVHGWSLNDLSVFNLPHLVDDNTWYRDREKAGRLLYGTLLEAEERWKEKKRNGEAENYTTFMSPVEVAGHLKTVEAELGYSLEEVSGFKKRMPPTPSVEEMEQGPPGKLLPPPEFDRLVRQFHTVSIQLPGLRQRERAQFHLFELTFPKLGNVPAVLLDATAHYLEPVLRKHFADKKLELLQGRVVATGYETLIWYRTTSYLSTRIRERKRLVRAIELDLDWLRGQTKRLTKKKQPDYGFITTLKIRPFLEQVLRERGLAAVIGHYGAIRGTNKFEDVDVLALLGDPVPNISQARYEAEIMGVDEKDRVQGIRNADLSQAIGRARGLRRTAKDPVLIACMTAARPPACPRRIEEARGGRPEGTDAPKLLFVVEKLLEEWGFVSHAMFDPQSPLHSFLREVRHKWLLKGDPLSYQLWRNSVALPDKTRRDKVNRLLLRSSETGRLRRIFVTNPRRKGLIGIFEKTLGIWENLAGELKVSPDLDADLDDPLATYSYYDEETGERVEAAWPVDPDALDLPQEIRESMAMARKALKATGKWFKVAGYVFGIVDMRRFWRYRKKDS